MRSKPGRSSRWKWARRIALCLVLGAVVNVGVAWGCAAWSPDSNVRSMGGYRLGYERPAWAPNFATCCCVWTHVRVSTGTGIEICKQYGMNSGTICRDRSFRVTVVAGWPLRSLRGDLNHRECHADHADERWTKLAWAARNSPTSVRLLTRLLPLEPLVTNFLLNTVFYGTVLFVPLFGVGVFKRRRRLNRGLCVRCAYDITGLRVCPECGQERKASGSRQQATGNPEKGTE